MFKAISFPWELRYSKKRPIYIGAFGIIYFIAKIIWGLQDNTLSAVLSETFTWIIPVLCIVTAWKMWYRTILKITENELTLYALFGPGERKYKYHDFSRLMISKGKLYLIKKDVDTEELRYLFLIAGWAVDSKAWKQLAENIQLAHS